MDPTHSSEADNNVLQREHLALLLDLARRSIALGAQDQETLAVSGDQQLPAILERPVASFVTIRVKKDDSLRGCMGTLQTEKSMINEVVTNANNAAYKDPRFLPLGEDEIDKIKIQISLINPLQQAQAADRQHLIDSLAQHDDPKPGLVLQDNRLNRSATFLPSVWEEITDAHQFVGQLLLKAGLDENHWSDQMTCFIYSSINFTE